MIKTKNSRKPMMSWDKLLSTTRINGAADKTAKPRSAFARDWDRLVFSWPFRRMQDKTQVFPLASSDYVRTRLTHTIEVASVGRSLGTLVGEWIADERHANVDASALSGATAAACIAHDIGNPPFGHSGESAIQTWFSTSATGQLIRQSLTADQAKDFDQFEGNAQAFRVLTKLEYSGGGLGLTAATLGAFSKYPRLSSSKDLPKRSYFKKHGIHHADWSTFKTLAEQLGLLRIADGAFSRHPLAYLVEAADDICYRIVDLEDAVVQKIVSPEPIQRALLSIFNKTERSNVKERLSSLDTDKAKFEYLRARSINVAIFSAFDAFKENYPQIMTGEFSTDLLSASSVASAFGDLKDIAKSKIYTRSSIVSIEVAGYEVIGGLLDAFAAAAHRYLAGQETRRDELVLNLLSPRIHQILKDDIYKSSYQRLLKITDFVAGMTDSYALDLFKRIKGITVQDGGHF